MTQVIWDATEALNSLRNQLAHNLEPTDLTRLLSRMKVGRVEGPLSLSNPKVVDRLGMTISLILGFLIGLRDIQSVERKKERSE